MSTVDNYQGEEADIVIVSLVRSDPSDGKIGFLWQPQRVNVLLSRARIGMILIGNAATLLAGCERRGVRTWQTVLNYVPRVAGLPVRCEKHAAEVDLCKPCDFRAHAADGGCSLDCAEVLQCGHKCTLKCHSARVPHAECVVPVPVKCALFDLCIACQLDSNLFIFTLDNLHMLTCPLSHHRCH